MKGLVAALVAMAVMTACDPPAPTPSRPAPSPYLYVCGDTVFDPAALNRAQGLEGDDRELRDLVESLNRAHPDTIDGWRVVAADAGLVHAVARIPREYVSRWYALTHASATFVRSGQGFKPDSFEKCEPQVKIGRRRPAKWELAVEPSPGDTRVVVAVQMACGTRKSTRRHTHADVAYAAESITLILTVDPFRPDCTDATWRLTVPLDEPVGNRALLDGSIYPPGRRYP